MAGMAPTMSPARAWDSPRTSPATLFQLLLRPGVEPTQRKGILLACAMCSEVRGKLPQDDSINWKFYDRALAFAYKLADAPNPKSLDTQRRGYKTDLNLMQEPIRARIDGGDPIAKAISALCDSLEWALGTNVWGASGAIFYCMDLLVVGGRRPDLFHGFEIKADTATALFREILANPFKPVEFSHSWRTSDTIPFAQGMYNSMDFSGMPVLADPLQDAGCTDPRILGHCQGPGNHVRGNWVVDLVLNKS